MARVTVAEYLKIRLEEQGVDRIFGVAGNYSAAFLNTIEEDPNTPLRISGNTNEINAGHCVDGYARVRSGLGVVCVTYGVGAFSVLNPVAGSYVEHVPVLVVNGAPAFGEQQHLKTEGLLYSHMTGDQKSNINVFRSVTVAAEQIRHAEQAPSKIDTVINAAISEGRPVYLEVFEDAWRQECAAPQGKLAALGHAGCASSTRQAAEATAEFVQKHGRPVFWAGIEIHRSGLQDAFANLLESTQIPYMSTILAKSVLSETNPLFRGVYNGKATPEPIKKIFECAGVRIGLGVFTTSKNLGGADIWSDSIVLANHRGVKVGQKYFADVDLGAFIKELKAVLGTAKYERYETQALNLLARCRKDSGCLTYDSFFASIDDYLTQSDIVVVDAGYPLLGAQNLNIRARGGFVSQAAWLSIGYSVPSAVGIKFAQPDKRVHVIVGDGAFQETCQEVSGHHFYCHDTVVFVLENTIYGIEQMLVNPNPFRNPDDPDPESAKKNYANELENTVYSYNNLNPWKYEKIVDMVGGQGFVAETHEELEAVLEEVRQLKDTNVVIRVKLPKTDIPDAISYKLAGVGEDETENPSWPPFCPPA